MAAAYIRLPSVKPVPAKASCSRRNLGSGPTIPNVISCRARFSATSLMPFTLARAATSLSCSACEVCGPRLLTTYLINGVL